MFHPRKNELSYLKSFIEKDDNFGLMYVKGKRRTGKTFILHQLEEKYSQNVFYFQGQINSKSRDGISSFRRSFKHFLSDKNINFSKYETSMKSWHSWTEIFSDLSEISKIFLLSVGKPLVLIFDEIQWIKSEGGSITSALKVKSYLLKMHSNIKIILCGSSQKFFHDHIDSSRSEMYNMNTSHDLVINPFTLAEIQEYCFPYYNETENAVIFMITGGMPFYLESLASQRGDDFYYDINRAFFLRDSIFLKEFDEILNLDFTKSQIKLISEIFFQLKSGQGVSRVNIVSSVNKDRKYISRVMDDLVQYGFLEKIVKINSETVENTLDEFILLDPFLLFYMNIFIPIINDVKINNKAHLFDKIFMGSSYYIPKFSGYAFEILCRKSFSLNFSHEEKEIPLFSKLSLDHNILKENIKTVKYYKKDQSYNQLDFTYQDENKAKKVYIFECKWAKEDLKWIKEMENKTMGGKKEVKVIFNGYGFSDSFIKKAKDQKIICISLNDLLYKK